MKNILEKLIETDTTYNKSVTRYLHKSHPELWQEILILTDFLPESAKPKQRIWHIINDIWEIPKCPITGEPVSWHENRYLKTKDYSSKAIYQHRRGDFKDNYTTEINEKRRQGIIKNFQEGRRKKPQLSSAQIQLRTQKCKETFIKNYGVDNPSKHSDIKRKLSESRIKNGATPKELRSDRRRYQEEVKKVTEYNWRKYYHSINPDNLNRSELALDHIFSIQEGFNQNIPPCWIGHWTNLRLITFEQNSKKGAGCDKTIDQLIDDVLNKVVTSYNISENGNSSWQKKRYQDGKHNFLGLNKKRIEDGSSNLLINHQCPHCGKTGQGPVMFRHHFSNCKNNKVIG